MTEKIYTRNRATPLDTLDEYHAQAMLNASTYDEVVAIASRYEEQLGSREEYTRIPRERDRERIYRINRRLRRVTMSAMSAVAFTQILHEVIPRLEQGEPLCRNHDLSMYDYPLTLLPKLGVAVEGSAAAYARSMIDIMQRGWDSANEFTQENPSHPYAAITDCWNTTLFTLRDKLGATYPSIDKQRKITAVDNTMISLRLLTHARLHYQRECHEQDRQPSTYEISRRALRSATQLGWAATGNVAKIGANLSKDILPAALPLLETTSYDDLPDAIRTHAMLVKASPERPDTYVYNHPTLTNGAWPVARYCPAASQLQLPDPKDRDIVRRMNEYSYMFNEQGSPNSAERPATGEDAFFNRATLLMQLGALAAYETIYRTWPSES